MATALIEFADFDTDYQWINWIGSSVNGYDVAAAWIPDEYGVTINFVGADTEIEARPETTLPETETAPETTVPDTETDGGDDTTTPPAATDSKTEDTTTTAPTTDPTTEAPKADEGGLPIGAIIGIVVVIAVVVVIVLKKRK